MGTLLAEFLRNRLQMVVTDGIQSVWKAVTIGVPQGTIHGPVLFLVLIADVSNGTDIHTWITSFADNTRLEAMTLCTSNPILVLPGRSIWSSMETSFRSSDVCQRSQTGHNIHHYY